MCRGVPQFFKNRGIHRCALRFYGDAEIGARPDGKWAPPAAAWPVEPSLEHKIEQRELSGATRRGSALHQDGREQIATLIKHYMGNAAILREAAAAPA